MSSSSFAIDRLSNGEKPWGPWGLPASLLAPAKVNTDPVHGDIQLTRLEQAIIDSPPLQRLQEVKQLGLTYLVYRGATHSRFSHVLGTLRVSDDLINAVLTHRNRPHARPDLFGQWRELKLVKDPEAEEARAIVLVRLGALLHDLCHVPFGHTVEDDLHILESHDKNGPRFDLIWPELSDFVLDRVGELADIEFQEASAAERKLYGSAGVSQDLLRDEFKNRVRTTLLSDSGELHKELRPLILGKEEGAPDIDDHRYPFAADLVGNTICADLLDYLQRDHLYCGLPMSLGTRFLNGLFIVPQDRGPYQRRAAFNITRRGHERTDVVTELLKALRYRYELSERVLDHHAKLAADAMLGKAVELWRDATWLENLSSPLVKAVEGDSSAKAFLANIEFTRLKERLVSLGLEAEASTGEDAAVQRLDKEFLNHGDGALLARIVKLAAGKQDDSQPELIRAAVKRLKQRSAELAEDLSRRTLFEGAGRVSVNNAPADKLFKLYGDHESRTRLERMAERYAGIKTPGKVILWIPNPKMRLKLAEVLVDSGGTINTFVDYERPRAGRGSDIYDNHARLWSLWVFFDRVPEKSEDSDLPQQVELQRQEKMVLAFLARQLGICWERYEERYGSEPSDWPFRLALSDLMDSEPRSTEVSEMVPSLEARAAEASRHRLERNSPETTFASLRQLAEEVQSNS